MSEMNSKNYKYVLVLVALVGTYSYTQCHNFLAFGREVGVGRAIYCRLTFFHLFSRPLSILDVVFHFMLWLALGLGLLRLYMRYLKDRMPW